MSSNVLSLILLLLWSTTDSYLLQDPRTNSVNELSHSASLWTDRKEHREEDSLRVGKDEVHETH